MKNIMRCLAIIALVAIIGFSFTACGDGDGDNGTGNGNGNGNSGNPNNPNNPGAGNRDSRLVNGANDAWVENDGDDGIILKADGTCLFLEDSGSVWSIFDSGTWSTSGNSLILTSNEYGTKVTYTYTVNGNNLTLKISGHTYDFTKQTVSVSGRSVE